jgi:FKBP-type peptidyl-prolyl cis-trans isomerase 2
MAVTVAAGTEKWLTTDARKDREMAEAKTGDKVQVHYTGTLNDGSTFDSSQGREPLEFTLGQGMVIPGFENGVLGMSPGDKKTVEIPADQAYGPHRPELVIEVEKTAFPEDMELEIGLQLAMSTQDGQQLPVQVVEFDDTNVKLDANPPLAGKDLTFALELVAIV